ncbi:DegV family protein [Actinospongicola halichondriae]|uniref:DegV family protein n=1 Tax=Actinospongicola halichondriae TaxID=3236844 RepID=UPI003D438F22
MKTGIVTDSNSQFPDALRDRYDIEIVPLTVTVDGVPYAEGVDLTADDFFARYAGGASPEVTTAAPAPGLFIEAYQRMADRGVDAILSIHIGGDVSATLDAARLAAEQSPVPVRLVDTGTASFGISCCVWEAAEALASGATIDEAAAVAEATAPTVDNVFVVGALDIVRAGGRLAADTESGAGVAVLSLVDGVIRRIGEVRHVDDATAAMVAHVVASGTNLRVAVGIADAGAEPLSSALVQQLSVAPEVREVVLYRVGPSVGAHTGPGTAGCFSWPANDRA